MNKFYISVSLMASLLLANKGLAQSAITLSSTYLPQAGYSYNMSTDTASGDMPSITVNAGSSTTQNWNYASVFNNVYGTSTSFVTPAGNPGAASFPNSNLASDQGGGNWAYFISGSTGLLLDGVDATIQGSPAIIDFNPNPFQIPTPFTIGGSVTSNYTATFTITVSGQTATVKHRAHRTINADAFGSLTTPTATYSNTLRVKTYETTSDSAFIAGGTFFVQAQYDTTTNYSWYQNAQNAIVMSIDQKTSGAATKAQYLQTFTNGINTIKQADFAATLYPNPAGAVTYLNYENATSSKVSANLFDITGRQVAALINNQQQAEGKQTLTIDATNLPRGLYLVQLTINGATKTLKLNVQ